MIEIIPEIEDMTPEVAAESIDTVVEVKKKQVFYDTTKNWNSDKTRIAQKGYIYVYSDYAQTTGFAGQVINVPGIKVGDGTSYLIDMPFAQGDVNEEVKNHITNKEIHVSKDDRERWDQREISIEISGENLTLS